MMPLADHDKLRVRCPRCNRSSAFKVGRLRASPEVKCPTCWASFPVDVSQLDEGVCVARQDYGLSIVDTARLKRDVLKPPGKARY